MDSLEEKISKLKWIDISIIQPTFIIICSNQKESEKFYNLLSSNSFELELHAQKDGTFEFHVIFTTTDDVIAFKSNKTIENYPPIKYLKNKQIDGISCGFFHADKVMHNRNLIPLDGNNIRWN